MPIALPRPSVSHELQPCRPAVADRIPQDRLAFDIDGVVADIMTTFLALARERYNRGHHLRYEHITTFRLEDCLDLPPWIIDEPHPGTHRPAP